MNTDTGEIKTAEQLASLANIDPEEAEKYVLMNEPATPRQMKRKPPKVGRNELCPCGSGIKFKKCCYTGR